MDQPRSPHRRQALECMAWGGLGLLWTMAGGVPRARLIGEAEAAPTASFSFVQLSDFHIGFNKPANPDVIGTTSAAVAQVKALPQHPAFLLHTGDASHLSQPGQFDTAAQLVGQTGLDAHWVPGEHDMLADNGRPFVARFQSREKPGAPGGGFYSFDDHGAHFIGLNNVVNLKAGGMGGLGAAQVAWLADDLKGRADSQPIVVFAHVPLWTVYAPWGWGTDDSAQALTLLRRFGSVTVLNGHIHQVMQKVEGNVAFHTARSTAFPQPAPGQAPSPGPMKVPADRLRHVLGICEVSVVPGAGPLAIVDAPLQG
jgi:3',5'-cyclic AMP phosphodiesterase CpdA